MNNDKLNINYLVGKKVFYWKSENALNSNWTYETFNIGS